nr:protein jagunal like [Tanacetum cinerariifolium]
MGMDVYKAVLEFFVSGKLLGEGGYKYKDQGGSGLKDLQTWNETLLLKQLWNMAAKKDTIWIKWINSEKLKRNKVRENMRYVIGNRKSISAWYDRWYPMNRFCDVITKKDSYDARLPDGCTAVVLLVAVFPILLTLLKKEPLETLSAASISIIFISVIIGELGRKRSRANFLKFYRVASSIGILGTIASVIQSSLQLKVIHDLSNWEEEKVALLKIVCVSVGLFVQIYSVTTTTSLIGNMSPPKRAS